jgi:hypothetical protein
MMKIKLILFFFTLVVLTSAQEPQTGAIKTKNGFLLFFNYPGNAFTLNLNENPKTPTAQFFTVNGKYVQFQHVAKKEFAKKGNSTLINFMKWETDYINENFAKGKDIELRHEILKKEGYTGNLWSYKNTLYKKMKKEDSTVTPVIRTYYFDFVHNDLIFRFVYASTTGDKSEARSILISAARKLTFYDKKIDLQRLQNAVLKGETTYL